ncbi:hypothetical protein FLM06_18460 [Vibrio cholerae]|uniref:hypothetical protein n=1 Tax=Vibrio cholerae TaxID=666 RepID=UPI00115851D8|nr:hypothetical protein [Vibrio cholerae]TQO74359.1 hypothetical protein FLM06_18460 [Vibrio cholerae]TQP19725.1 hypothetical protein FLL94_18750 [Vibrio cholerae]TQP40762.1 hypothetical protein FLL99_18655 [Vibrio cholerae]
MKLLTENIWSFISKSSRNSDKAYVAVAYLGNGASEKLLLKSGDMLVVDASESNVRSGVALLRNSESTKNRSQNTE